MDTLTDPTGGVTFTPTLRPCIGRQYVQTVNGGIRLVSKPNPSPYADDSNPANMPSDNLRLKALAADRELAENAALLASLSRANGEGHARDNKPWQVGRHEVVMPLITSDNDLLTWLLQPGLTERVSGDTTETGLHSICYRLCMEDVRFLRVHQRERHHSVASEAAANAANLLWSAVLAPESTVRVRGKHKGKTLLESSLESGGGTFPIMRLVGWICSLETMSELNRSRIEYTQEKAAELTRKIEQAQEDTEQEHDVDSWVKCLYAAAIAEQAGKGTATLRQDMFALYRFLHLNLASANRASKKTGTVSREAVAQHFGWSKSKHARVLMELAISRQYWFRPEEIARKNEASIREDYRRGFIGDKAQQAANRAAKV